MLTKAYNQRIFNAITRHNFLPQNMAYFVPSSAEILKDFYLSKMVPTRNRGFFYRERQLTCEFVDYLLLKLKVYDKINIIEIGPALTYAVAPYLIALEEEGRLGSYVTVNPAPYLNEINEYSFDRIDVIANPVLDNFDEIHALMPQDDNLTYANVFVYFNDNISKHSPDEIKSMLKNIRTSMKDDDVLLVTYTTPYANLEYAIKNHEDIPRLPQLELMSEFGINSSNMNYKIGFNDNENQLEAKFVFTAPVNMTFDLAGGRQSVAFEPGQALLGYRNRRFKTEDFESLARQSGLKISDLNFARVDSYALAMLRKE
ncbi:MAG: hypothetical protein OHK0017_06070 [Patescibacteria group bacterium]